MKSAFKMTAVLVAVVALTATAEAAPTKARSGQTKSGASKGTKVAAVKKSVKKPQVSDVSAASSDVQITETAKLSEVKPLVQAKKWSVGGFTETYGASLKAVSENTLGKKGADGKAQGDLATDMGINLGYKVEDTVTISAAAEWGQAHGVADAQADTVMYDPSLRVSKSGLADLGNGIGVNGQARLYLPVSEASQDKEQIAQIRLYATASREITKALSASFTLNPRIFIQQNDTYINAEGKEKNLDQFRLLSSAAMKYSVNDWFALEQTFGLYQKWRTNTARADFLDASTSAYIAPASWIELNLGVRQIDEATDTRAGGLRGLYSADQTEYFLITSFSI